VKPPLAEGLAIGAWRGVDIPAARPHGFGRRIRGVSAPARHMLLAAVVLVAALAAAAYVAERPGAEAPAGASHGTAFLGSATCADWQAAGDSRRLTIIGALATAATQPDPENPGATLSQGSAYGLFERACATTASQHVLLYETYNRAASFAAPHMAQSASWGSSARR
jgi:hypothetical protein